MKYLATGIVAFLVLAGGILFGHSLIPSSSQLSGSTGFTPVSGKTYYLAGAGVTSSANTITLSSFTLPDPNNTPIQSSMFSGTQYGVLEAQTSKTEDITFTGVTQNANGTATLTGVTRGISFYSPFVASTTLQLAHAGGATFILSNPAAFYAQFLTANNNASIESLFTFSSTSPPVYDADPIWANFSTQALADVSYVNSVVAAGCANGSTTVKGCVQIATARQAASSTVNGSTGAIDVLQSSYATDTPSTSGCATSSGGCVVMSLLNGKINQLWLDLTQAFTWTGLNTFNAGGIIDNASSTFTSTLNANGTVGINKVAYTFPSSQGIANTFLENNGSGTLSWNLPYNLQYATTSTATLTGTATSSVFSIPAGILTASSTITAQGIFNCSTNGGCTMYFADSANDVLATYSMNPSNSGATYNLPFFITVTSNGLNSQYTLMTGSGYLNSGTPYVGTVDVEKTTSINFASITGFEFAVTTSGGTISNYNIIVRP